MKKISILMVIAVMALAIGCADKKICSSSEVTAPVNFEIKVLDASSVLLTWSPNPAGEEVMGYKVFVGEETHKYKPAINVGNVITDGLLSYRATGLVNGRVYFFTVRPYLADGKEGPAVSEKSSAPQPLLAEISPLTKVVAVEKEKCPVPAEKPKFKPKAKAPVKAKVVASVAEPQVVAPQAATPQVIAPQIATPQAKKAPAVDNSGAGVAGNADGGDPITYIGPDKKIRVKFIGEFVDRNGRKVKYNPELPVYVARDSNGWLMQGRPTEGDKIILTNDGFFTSMNQLPDIIEERFNLIQVNAKGEIFFLNINFDWGAVSKNVFKNDDNSLCFKIRKQ